MNILTKFTSLRSWLKWRRDVIWLKISLKVRNEFTTILWLTGMGLIDNGIRMYSVPGAWIFAGGVMGWLAIKLERSSQAPTEEGDSLKTPPGRSRMEF